MARQNINLGTAPDGAGGDDVRGAFTKTNANFTELYTEAPQAEAQAGTAATVRGWTARRVLDAVAGWWNRLGKVGNGRVMLEGAGGLLGSDILSTSDSTNSDTFINTKHSQINLTSGGDPDVNFGSGLHLATEIGRPSETHRWIVMGVTLPRLFYKLYRKGVSQGDKPATVEVYTTYNTTVASDGTLKKASPIIKLYRDTHEIESEGEFGLTPTVTKLSAGVYEIKGTLGLRSDSWFLDTPQDRNGNKYFNVDYEQTTGTVVDGVFDAGEIDSLDDLPELEPSTVIIKCFERVWNPKTGIFENGEPVDIKEGRYITLRFNEVKYTIKPEQEEVNNENI